MSTVLMTIGYICTTPMCYENFVISMMALLHYNMSNGINAWYTRSHHGSQAHARNDLVRSMQGEWLFMIDTDMDFSPNTVERLLKVANENKLEVVSGLYYKRAIPYFPLAYFYKPEDNTFHHFDPFEQPEPVVEVDACGAGCLLIKKSVFERIATELKEEPFTILPPLSEDFSFYKRLNQLGIKSYVVKDVQCGHFGITPITKNNYDNWKLANQAK